MPDAMPIGHDAALDLFRTGIASGRLHHAWLLTGPEGIGKATLAMQFARILLLAEDGNSPAGKRVSAGTHADLLRIARGLDEKKNRLRAEIVADEVRPAGDFLRRTAAEGGWRVVLIDGADRMNRNAANALLKILEEPPARAVLILTCDAPGRLLPTIRSRCRLLPLAPLEDRDVADVLARNGVSDVEISRVLPHAQGSPGRALRYLGDTDGTIEAAVQSIIAGKGAPGDEYGFAESIARGDNGFPAFFTLLCDEVSSRARQSARSGDGSTAARLAALWDTLNRIRSETERSNLDKLQAVLSAVSTMSEI